MGCSMSAPGILLPALQDEHDPNMKVNLDTGANLATVWLATGTLVAAFGGWLADRYGRRMVLILLGQPLLAASWSMTAAANHLWWMYAARVVSGVSDGLIFPLVAVYIAEISSAKMRGKIVIG